MKVILLGDIKGVGKKDQVIEASDGYARNFLFPKKLAVEANNENMSKLKSKQESNQFRKDTEKKEAEELAKDSDLVLFFGGIFRGEAAVVLSKAIKLCMECVGIG